MRFNQFNENSALDKASLQIRKNFTPERAAIQDQVNRLVRMVEMGKGNKLELARDITALTKSELQAKAEDPDLKYSVDQNIGMMKRAMDMLKGDMFPTNTSATQGKMMGEDNAEKIIKVTNIDFAGPHPDKMQLPTSVMLRLNVPDDADQDAIDEMVADDLLDRYKVKVTGFKTQFVEDIKEAEDDMYRDMSAEEEQFVDMVVDYYYNDDDERNSDYDAEKMERAYDIAGGDPSNSVARGDFLHREITSRLGLRESAEETITEEQFDEAAGKKDACYRKVKSRYKVWPSAYASGALVQCRKVGAANWGNSKKK